MLFLLCIGLRGVQSNHFMLKVEGIILLMKVITFIEARVCMSYFILC